MYIIFIVLLRLTNYSIHRPALSCLLLFCFVVELQLLPIIPNMRRGGMQPGKRGQRGRRGAINTVIKVL